jgi:hypothetical protein
LKSPRSNRQAHRSVARLLVSGHVLRTRAWGFTRTRESIARAWGEFPNRWTGAGLQKQSPNCCQMPGSKICGRKSALPSEPPPNAGSV